MKWLAHALTLFAVMHGLALTSFGMSIPDTQERIKAMLKDAEEMVMHGGMGDAKAILRHCHEVSTHAKAILQAFPLEDPRSKDVAVHLNEAINHCQRVARIGDPLDHGLTLSPAIKARAAAREAAKRLSSAP